MQMYHILQDILLYSEQWFFLVYFNKRFCVMIFEAQIIVIFYNCIKLLVNKYFLFLYN